MKEAVYKQIANTIGDEIRKGSFLSGERLYSRDELRKQWNISEKTAVRVQNVLAETGLVRKVKGSGIFVNHFTAAQENPLPEENVRLNKIVHFSNADSKFEHNIKFNQALKAMIAESGLEYESRECTPVGHAPDRLVVQPHTPGTGYVLLAAGVASLFSAGSLLLSPYVRCVLVDSIIPGSHSVLKDNWADITALLEFLVERRCRHVCFAANFFRGMGHVNENGRRRAFEYLAPRMGLRTTIVDNGDFTALATLAGSKNPPDAIMFTQDTPAVRMRKILQESGHGKIPLLTGFDNFSRESGTMPDATICPDFTAMARASVEVLRLPVFKHEIIHIPGKIKINR